MDNIKVVEDTIKELLSAMSFEGDVKVDDRDDKNIVVNIQTDQAGFLIGQAGASLDALQFVSRLLISKRLEEPIRFVLDVNNYRKNRMDLLKEMAKDIAKQSLTQRVAVTLQPMPAYERRIIHLSLMEHPDVTTTSVGEGDERKVVVKPIE